jgi:hypothetical protein
MKTGRHIETTGAGRMKTGVSEAYENKKRNGE